MKEQFFAHTDNYVKFTPAEKDLLAAVLTFRKVNAKTELVSFCIQRIY
ncbi:hypothetical protein [Mucilaginibacter sp. R-33]